ncbi:polysaccharide biosynthesis/export family protein [Puniceicoccus vermicola]|uniref:Polysaccharide export protein n=1 Tax=Puniceicoccus vermicola TaxID=388746 RepID=A0A7X1AWR5_9BACT|nr:polysaccharide biosynthesis/export family protein [Puniceicoccus vermicola]MBC2601418.1 polysaccharide export protein [Puniceicoccus vermicola]
MKPLSLCLLAFALSLNSLVAQTDSGDSGGSSSSDSGSAGNDGMINDRDAMVAPVNYRIQPSDILSVQIYQQMDLDKETRVEADGTISLHLVGRVNVEGLTISEAREKITELYDRDYLVNPQVDLQVIQFNLDEVQVLGQVRTPGTIAIPPDQDLTLLQAISRAGGFTRLARKGSVKIRREMEDGEKKVFAINASDLISDPDSQDFVLQDGDIVFVDERLI